MLTKQFFTIIKDRLNVKFKLTPNYTAIVTAHGKTKAYLHRFQIIRVSRMPLRRRGRNGGPPVLGMHQTADGEKLISNISKQDNWPWVKVN